MNKEQEQRRPARLTLEDVTRKAREVTLVFNGHIPTVIAEGKRQGVVLQLAELETTHEGRVYQMFQAGFTLAQRESVGALDQVFFISEAWMSRAENGEIPERPPSQDPHRIEVLIVSHFKPSEQQTSAVILEMLRGADGRLMELKELQRGDDPESQVESPLLMAFVAGFEMGMGAKTD